MDKTRCACCYRQGNKSSFAKRKVRNFRTFEDLYFCKDSNCYLNYMKARQTPSAISRAIKNHYEYGNN